MNVCRELDGCPQFDDGDIVRFCLFVIVVMPDDFRIVRLLFAFRCLRQVVAAGDDFDVAVWFESENARLGTRSGRTRKHALLVFHAVSSGDNDIAFASVVDSDQGASAGMAPGF